LFNKIKNNIEETKKDYMVIVKEEAIIRIFNIKELKGTRQWKGSDYVLYDCEFFYLKGQEVPNGKHVWQLPLKTGFSELVEWIEENNLEGEIILHVKRIKKYYYEFDIIKVKDVIGKMKGLRFNIKGVRFNSTFGRYLRDTLGVSIGVTKEVTKEERNGERLEE
jgi:hypothetical protein